MLPLSQTSHMTFLCADLVLETHTYIVYYKLLFEKINKKNQLKKEVLKTPVLLWNTYRLL